VGGSLIESLTVVSGLMTFPADMPGGSPSAPITVSEGFQLLLI